MKKVLLAVFAAISLSACKSPSDFSQSTIDIGIVARDADASVKFYQDVVGMKKVDTFTLPKSIVGDAGLGDYKDCTINFMQLDDSETATKLKIMSFPGQQSLAPNKFIDTTCGISYITIFVKDADKLVARLKEMNVPILAKGPASFAPVNFAPNFLTVVKDPDGNFVELIGPMK